MEINNDPNVNEEVRDMQEGRANRVPASLPMNNNAMHLGLPMHEMVLQIGEEEGAGSINNVRRRSLNITISSWNVNNWLFMQFCHYCHGIAMNAQGYIGAKNLRISYYSWTSVVFFGNLLLNIISLIGFDGSTADVWLLGDSLCLTIDTILLASFFVAFLKAQK